MCGAVKPIPRSEYPRPSMSRGEDSWVCLNGEWDFAFDFGTSGRARKMYENGTFPEKITVPFVPESQLSGIEYVDFIPAVWYRRTFTLPAAFVKGQSHLLLHFGAVDYASEVWVNGRSVGTHKGGYTPFVFDITDVVTDGENTVVVTATDDTRDPLQPTGKQSVRYENYACSYTRCTGIWQTVWLEVVPEAYIEKIKLTHDVAGEKLDVTVRFAGDRLAIGEVRAVASFEGEEVAAVTAKVNGIAVSFSIPVKDPILWDLGKPNLYDLTISAGEDMVVTYFGMRSVAWNDRAFLLNGRPVFQRLVLDQGYYPDGIYTAATDDELRLDVEHYDFDRPYFISECGGIYWNLDIDSTDPSWGYGEAPKSKEEYITRLRGLVTAMADSPNLFGYCYTQLTDVFQEKNGVYAFDRREKFDAATLREIFGCPAAIEKTE